MGNSLFFTQGQKEQCNSNIIDGLSDFSNTNKEQIYIISKPLGENRYSYNYDRGIVVLSPKRKLTFINIGTTSEESEFNDFVLDFIEDLGSLSDKYQYKDKIGRPRKWREEGLILELTNPENAVNEWKIQSSLSNDLARQRKVELLISLLTGSINDIKNIGAELPDNLLDKVKKKIILFDGDQTRFIYEQPRQKSIKIQGLSGTGKTELLLHKLKNLYINHANSKIAFACHTKILAAKLRERIPDFFNFMRVDEQIKWEERLWCFNAWGRSNNANSGLYRFVCDKYGVPFRSLGFSSFEAACKEALKYLDAVEHFEPCFDYILIDESQDFGGDFITLCEKISSKNVYVAGDIFQNIFCSGVSSTIEPDYLLSKCYRTDPRTLMFSHAIAMGLFEQRKLHWLEDKEWEACGYNIEKLNNDSLYQLRREPLRRFEDIDTQIPSVKISTISSIKWDENVIKEIEKIINELKVDHPSLSPEDIAIIFLDTDDGAYKLADKIDGFISIEFEWPVNKAYETKKPQENSLFISNKNNVKGLEFPFVICITRSISFSQLYRNTLYMTLTRSFIQSILITTDFNQEEVIKNIQDGLEQINKNGFISVCAPSIEERSTFKTTINTENTFKPLDEIIDEILNEEHIPQGFHDEIRGSLNAMSNRLENADRKSVKNVLISIYDSIKGLKGVRLES